MTVVPWSTPEPMWLYLTPQHDGFLCNAIWGLKGQAHSTELALRVLWFLWIPWISSQYHVWYLVKDLNSLQFCIAKSDFWFVWHFSHEIWLKVLSYDLALIAKTEMLLLYPNMIPWPITKFPCFRYSINLFNFILPRPKFLGICLQPSKTNFVIFTKYIYGRSVKLWKSFSQLNKSWGLTTDPWFYCIFTKCPNFSEIGVVVVEIASRAPLCHVVRRGQAFNLKLGMKKSTDSSGCVKWMHIWDLLLGCL